MFKLVGIIGLICSTGLIGIYKESLLKRRVDLLNDFYKLVIEIKAQINYFKEPLPELFNKLSNKNSFKADLLINDIRHEMFEKTLQIRGIWALKVKEIYRNEPLHKTDLDLISYLGEFIGQTDYENQIFQFEYLESKLTEQIEHATEELNKRGPLLKKTGFIIGIIISIVLI